MQTPSRRGYGEGCYKRPGNNQVRPFGLPGFWRWHDGTDTRSKLGNHSVTDPVWLDLITGGIHEIPAEKMARDGDKLTFKDIPVYDAPTLIADKSLSMK